jgi:phenylpyruvate tautomerase PptA (4-oxalocrotonate tautomerase family)
MPLARIDLAQGKSADYRKTIGDVVYDAMVETLKAPKDDRFQVITEHAPDSFIFDPNYLGIARSKDCVFVQLTLNEGRTVDQKRAFYKTVMAGLHQRLDLRPEDLLINLVEVRKENWSFGNGEAQYV